MQGGLARTRYGERDTLAGYAAHHVVGSIPSHQDAALTFGQNTNSELQSGCLDPPPPNVLVATCPISGECLVPKINQTNQRLVNFAQF